MLWFFLTLLNVALAKVGACQPSIVQSLFQTASSPWVSAPVYPDFVALPGTRTSGLVHGPAFQMTTDGFKANALGIYDVSMSVVLFGNETAPDARELNVFATVNGQFSQFTTNLVGSFNTLGPGAVLTFANNGFVVMQANETLSFVINNGGGNTTTWDARVQAWMIKARTTC